MTMEKAWEKYNKSRRTMLAYNGGTCNKHDFKAGYEAALADTADQLREARVKVLREAAATILARYFAHDATNYLNRMVDELEKADAIRGLA